MNEEWGGITVPFWDKEVQIMWFDRVLDECKAYVYTDIGVKGLFFQKVLSSLGCVDVDSFAPSRVMFLWAIVLWEIT